MKNFNLKDLSSQIKIVLGYQQSICGSIFYHIFYIHQYTVEDTKTYPISMWPARDPVIDLNSYLLHLSKEDAVMNCPCTKYHWIFF
jgi:hypothetical protein